MADQMDLLREQVKMLAGEVALCTSSLKRLSEQTTLNPDDTQLQAQMKRLKDEIAEKKRQIRVIERRIVGNGEAAYNNAAALELSQTISKLSNQLNEKSFELEIKSADNRILQEQLQTKVIENTELQNTIAALRQQLAEKMESIPQQGEVMGPYGNNSNERSSFLSGELSEHLAGAENEAGLPTETRSLETSKVAEETSSLQSQILQQAMEIEKLKQEKDILLEEKDALQIRSCKLAEESSYARELASAAAMELKNLAEEVTKLSYQNSKLAAELATAQELAYACPKPPLALAAKSAGRQRLASTNARRLEEEAIAEDLRRELLASKEREAALEAGLAERELKDSEIRKKLEEAKRREADLENDLAGMWVLVAKLRKARGNIDGTMAPDAQDLSAMADGMIVEDGTRHVNGTEKILDFMHLTALKNSLEKEKQHNAELELLVSQLKSEDLSGLDVAALEDLSALHVEALTRLCHAKATMQQGLENEKANELLLPSSGGEHPEEDESGHVCKVCFEAPTAAVLLPCRHLSLCKSCAVACTECPLCRTTIQDRIIAFTS